jgi:YQGE family putative transporter
MGSVMGTIAPIISGWIIVSNTSLKGYYLLFFVSLLLFTVSIVLSYFLHQERMLGKYQFKSVLFDKADRPWNKIMTSNYIAGFRDGALAYIVNILIFLVLKNELNMGKFTTVISVLGIASTYITGRIYKKKHENIMLAAGAILSFAGTVILVVWTNYWGIIINGVLTSVFSCFWGIPYSIINYEIAGKSASKNNNMGDYMIVKEVPLALGRISGIVLYIVVSRLFMDETAIKVILPLLSSMIIVNLLYLKTRYSRVEGTVT